ncbi:globin family protein [Leptothoe sp. PORK10 BA2]|uniref:globin family protein n=1 Tax=Leptothoe sp. PORK10 BA2 TaxID=3110254 RepID=UPI002B210198|nr:globin family protein [Leptothoe sp. PORK10 BA2]MEA5467076.1 globin family protein [Leptothoe sp. PORK10 BA2]
MISPITPVAKDMPLNVERLEQSFELVKGRGDEFTAQFYANLFSDYPLVKPLFANTHMEEQGKKLFASLVLVVDALRQPEVLESAVKGLGTRHVKYGVLPEHYPMVGGALLKTFESVLGTDWTADEKQAWADAYGAVSQLMLEGADYLPEVLSLSN